MAFDREVPAGQVFLEGLSEFHQRLPAQGQDVLAEGGDLQQGALPGEDPDRAVLDPHRDGPGKSRRTTCGGALVARSQSPEATPRRVLRTAPPTAQVSNPASSRVRATQRTWGGAEGLAFITPPGPILR